MNRIRSWIRAFFGFSRNETNAFLLLLPLMFLIIFIVPTYRTLVSQQEKDYSNEKKELDSVIATWRETKTEDSLVSTTPVITLFRFNPNTVRKNELVSLGFSTYLADRLENYRNKGGKFIVKSDLLKLYGMDSALYKTLYAWIDLPTEKPIKTFGEKEKTTAIKKPEIEKFDLNQADSSQLISIYGVGSKLSTRIIKYRNRLGGFISTDQLTEVYGLDSLVINELKKKTFITENFKPRVIEINAATEKDLATHPYLKYTIAKAIIAYRFQHGNFKSVDDLTKIAIIDKATFEKIKPYLSSNP